MTSGWTNPDKSLRIKINLFLLLRSPLSYPGTQEQYAVMTLGRAAWKLFSILWVIIYSKGQQTPALLARSDPLSVFTNKVFLECSHTALFTYYLWLLLQYKVVETETIRPTKPKIFSIWAFVEKVRWPLIYRTLVFWHTWTLSCFFFPLLVQFWVNLSFELLENYF